MGSYRKLTWINHYSRSINKDNKTAYLFYAVYYNYIYKQENDLPIQDIYSMLISDESRNNLILNDLLQALDEGRSPILLTERREHLEYFVSKLEKSR